MRLVKLGIALSIAALLVGCHDLSVQAPTADLGGVYGYVAQAGNADVVTGIVRLQVQDDSSVTGTWELQRVPGSDTSITVGPQLGSGTLQGRRSAHGVWLDLNPGWADNNVFLALLPEVANTLSGTWDHSTIVGPVAGGSVRLQRLVR